MDRSDFRQDRRPTRLTLHVAEGHLLVRHEWHMAVHPDREEDGRYSAEDGIYKRL